MFSCCLLAALAKCSAVRTFCSVCSRTTSRASPIQPCTNLGVSLLELKEPHAVGEELLGRPGVLLLEPHELEPAFGDPDGAALSCGEVLGYGLEGVALYLRHLTGGAS